MEKENERKKRGETLLFRAGLHSLKFPSSNFRPHSPSTSSPGSSLATSENEKTEGMRLVLNYRLEKAVKCLGKKWVDVPGAHAVDITVRLLEPGHLKKIMQLRFSKTKASLESWIFVGPFEKKLENLLF